MKPIRKKRLKLISLIFTIACIAVALLLYAMRDNLNHYYSLQTLAEGNMPVEQVGIRVGGMVKKGSLVREPNTLHVSFQITDFKNPPLTMEYTGILPDLFREGQGVIAKGRLDRNGIFHATEILAKHDEKYMPPEVAADMQRSGYNHKQGTAQ